VRGAGTRPGRCLFRARGILIFAASLPFFFLTAADPRRQQVQPAEPSTTSGSDLKLVLERVADAPLKTRLFWHAYVVMGSLGLLSRERQAEHDYRVAREEKAGRERLLVVEAVPKPGVRSDRLVGTIWLRLSDAGILKIEWNPSSIDNHAGVEETAKRLGMTPQIVLTSEYAIEQKGIRFPSRYSVKEIYTRRNGRRFQRSQTDVLYDQYKFFTVETDVKY